MSHSEGIVPTGNVPEGTVTLPFEIISKIFLAACSAPENHKYAYFPDLPRPFVFAHVCRLWHAVAVRERALWTDIQIFTHSNVKRERPLDYDEYMAAAARQFAYLRLCFERAGGLPVSVYIGPPSRSQVFDDSRDRLPGHCLHYILQRADQWRCLEVRAPTKLLGPVLCNVPADGTPNLETLIIFGYEDDQEFDPWALTSGRRQSPLMGEQLAFAPRSPLLTTVEYTCVTMPPLLHKLVGLLPFNQLTRLKLDPHGEGLSGEKCIALLHHTPCLQHATLYMRSNDPFLFAREVTLTALVDLEIEADELDFTSFFARLMLPALVRLSVTLGFGSDPKKGGPHWPADACAAFVLRSECNLEALELQRLNLFDEELIELLHVLPSLARLRLDISGDDPLTDRLLESLTVPSSGNKDADSWWNSDADGLGNNDADSSGNKDADGDSDIDMAIDATSCLCPQLIWMEFKRRKRGSKRSNITLQVFKNMVNSRDRRNPNFNGRVRPLQYFSLDTFHPTREEREWILDWLDYYEDINPKSDGAPFLDLRWKSKEIYFHLLDVCDRETPCAGFRSSGLAHDDDSGSSGDEDEDEDEDDEDEDEDMEVDE